MLVSALGRIVCKTEGLPVASLPYAKESRLSLLLLRAGHNAMAFVDGLSHF